VTKNRKPTTPSTSSSANKKATDWLRENKCPVHHEPLPCLRCKERDPVPCERDPEVEEWLEKELARLPRKDQPEEWLPRIGVPKRYLSSSFRSFRGGTPVVALCKRVVLRPFSLVLWGGNGSGKTHLSVAILRERVRHGFTDDLFVSAPDLLLKIREGFDHDYSETTQLKMYQKTSILVLDDLGAEKATDWAVSTISLIIDKRYRDVLPTVITTNLDPTQLEDQLGGRISSRLASMKNVHVNLPDWRKKR
jgi:DNA replication protein DnaC